MEDPTHVVVEAMLDVRHAQFDEQRLALRRLLTYFPAELTWQGRLPTAVHLNIPAWEGLLDVARKGGGVWIAGTAIVQPEADEPAQPEKKAPQSVA